MRYCYQIIYVAPLLRVFYQSLKNSFYDIDSHLMYKQSEISMLITDKTKLIMFVDYFGVETQLESSLKSNLKIKISSL